MMWVLSLIHSHIVSTISGNDHASQYQPRKRSRTFRRRRRIRFPPVNKVTVDCTRKEESKVSAKNIKKVAPIKSVIFQPVVRTREGAVAGSGIENGANENAR